MKYSQVMDVPYAIFFSKDDFELPKHYSVCSSNLILRNNLKCKATICNTTLTSLTALNAAYILLEWQQLVQNPN